MKKFLISISTIVLLGCNSSSNKNDFKSDNDYYQYVKEYRKTEIDSIILHHRLYDYFCMKYPT
jgi:Tfp pilus assembly protein PilP